MLAPERTNKDERKAPKSNRGHAVRGGLAVDIGGPPLSASGSLGGFSEGSWLRRCCTEEPSPWIPVQFNHASEPIPVGRTVQRRAGVRLSRAPRRMRPCPAVAARRTGRSLSSGLGRVSYSGRGNNLQRGGFWATEWAGNNSSREPRPFALSTAYSKPPGPFFPTSPTETLVWPFRSTAIFGSRPVPPSPPSSSTGFAAHPYPFFLLPRATYSHNFLLLPALAQS